MYQRYQNRVIGPSEVVCYDQIVMSCYPPYAINREPFVGTKILLRDTCAFTRGAPANRLAELDQFVKMTLPNSGCIVRESKSSSVPDGLWLISLPVPMSQLKTQMHKVINLIRLFSDKAGIVLTGLFEIAVSGRCTEHELCSRLRQITMTDAYMGMMVKPSEQQFSAYDFGYVTPINDKFVLMRTRWYNRFLEAAPTNVESYKLLVESIDYVTLKLSVVFH